MDTPSITDILRRQLEPTIEMLHDVIKQCSDEFWASNGRNAAVWQHVYHATFWLNAWARDWTTPFEKPPFHSGQALELETDACPVITRDQMRDYLGKVESECMSFLDGLTDETLVAEEEAFGRTWTPADRILAQIRHVQHHVGMIHAAIKEASGGCPRWMAFNE